MTTSIQAGVWPACNPREASRATRGLRLHAERGHEIAEVEPRIFRVHASTGGGFYRVDQERGTFECRDRASICKRNLASETIAAKCSCRRQRTAGRLTRRHAEVSRRPSRDRRAPGDTGGPARADGSLRGVHADLGRLDRLTERLGV